MDPEVMEEWYHVKTGRESPRSAKGRTPREYLVIVFGDDKLLPELERYAEAVKFDHGKWIDIGLTVLQFLPVAKWIGVGSKIGGVLWQALKKLRK